MIYKEIRHKKVELEARNEEQISTLYMRAEKQCFFECAGTKSKGAFGMVMMPAEGRTHGAEK